MKHFSRVLVFTACVALFSSCKKDETIAPNPEIPVEQNYCYVCSAGNQYNGVFNFEYCNADTVEVLNFKQKYANFIPKPKCLKFNK